MSLYGKIIFWLRNYCRLIFRGDRFALEIRRWFADDGDCTLRLDYELTEDCVVFDVGGYEGKWAEAISAKFDCRIYIFEPVPCFAASVSKRFAGNTRVRVYPYGLASKDGEQVIRLLGNASSFYAGASGATTMAAVRRFDVELLKDLDVGRIDIMKINIEGGEYDLLDLMIENKTIWLVNNLQIQFHNLVPNAIERRNDIRRRLGLTHYETWCYEFVWENWKLKSTQNYTDAAG